MPECASNWGIRKYAEVFSRPYTNTVIHKFDRFEEALEFYHSSETTELAKFRDQVIEVFATVLSGHSEAESILKSNYFTTNATAA